jgi:hypothetical protein
MIQILLLKNDLVLISEIEQVSVDQFSGQPDYKLTNPVQILCKDEEPDINKRLVPWPDRDLTNSTAFSIYSDDILTVMEPHEKLLEIYSEMTK